MLFSTFWLNRLLIYLEKKRNPDNAIKQNQHKTFFVIVMYLVIQDHM